MSIIGDISPTFATECHNFSVFQKFSPRAGRPKFNQLEMATTFTYKPSLVKIDARNFELS